MNYGVTDQTKPELLRQFFIGRDDVFAEQDDKGGYRPVRRPLVPQDLLDHVAGTRTLGSYTIDTQGLVRCVTWDVDTGKIQDVFALVGRLDKPWTVFTSGNKGWHVIQSFSPKVPAADARAYGLAIKEAAGLGENEKIEVFPKQVEIEPGKFGNLTKLPWARHRVTGRFSEKVMGDFGYTEGSVLGRVCSGTGRVPVETGQGAAGSRARSGGGDPTQVRAGTHRHPAGEAWLVSMFEGDIGTGRNNSLRRFYYWLHHSRGFPPELARINVEWVNDNCWPEPLDDEEVNQVCRD